jgi:hypothetical protein
LKAYDEYARALSSCQIAQHADLPQAFGLLGVENTSRKQGAVRNLQGWTARRREKEERARIASDDLWLPRQVNLRRRVRGLEPALFRESGPPFGATDRRFARAFQSPLHDRLF